MKISLKKLFVEGLGYQDNTWKAARTRATGNNSLEVVDEKGANEILMKIATAKQTKTNAERIVKAQKILGARKLSLYVEDSVANVPAKENEVEKLKAEIVDLKKEIEYLNLVLNLSKKAEECGI
ncbi:MAG: hypothetical protein ACRDCW_03005 [Sarcina sp.]